MPKKESIEAARREIGFDSNRIWSNQAAVLPAADGTHILIVFREHANVDLATVGEKVELTKTVASMIMPRNVAASLGTILTDTCAAAEPEEDGSQDGSAS